MQQPVTVTVAQTHLAKCMYKKAFSSASTRLNHYFGWY